MTRLIDADALLEALDIKIKFETDEPINNVHKLINDTVVDEVKKVVEQYRQCIRNIITNAPTVQREGWVSVEDRLPEEEKEYLVFGNCTNDGFRCDIAYFLHGVFEKFNQPTHWQPLPNPPAK